MDLVELMLEVRINSASKGPQVRLLQQISGRIMPNPGKQEDQSQSHFSMPQHSQCLIPSHFSNQSLRNQQLTVDLCTLVNPLIFWFNYSVENKDRLAYFKVVWRNLTCLLDILPANKVKTDCVQVVMPVLERIDRFCQTSSPSQEMLQFLKIVLTDIKSVVLQQKALQKSKLQFLSFLENFLVVFTKVIPHNLHDEVFHVCELLLDILGS